MSEHERPVPDNELNVRDSPVGAEDSDLMDSSPTRGPARVYDRPERAVGPSFLVIAGIILVLALLVFLLIQFVF